MRQTKFANSPAKKASQEQTRKKGGTDMNRIFYVIGVVVVVIFVARYFGLM